MNVSTFQSMHMGFKTFVDFGYKIGLPILEKVIEISLYYFEAISQTCFCVLGVNEFYRRGVKPHDELIEAKQKKMAEKTHETFFQKIKYQLKRG